MQQWTFWHLPPFNHTDSCVFQGTLSCFFSSFSHPLTPACHRRHVLFSPSYRVSSPTLNVFMGKKSQLKERRFREHLRWMRENPPPPKRITPNNTALERLAEVNSTEYVYRVLAKRYMFLTAFDLAAAMFKAARLSIFQHSQKYLAYVRNPRHAKTMIIKREILRKIHQVQGMHAVQVLMAFALLKVDPGDVFWNQMIRVADRDLKTLSDIHIADLIYAACVLDRHPLYSKRAKDQQNFIIKHTNHVEYSPSLNMQLYSAPRATAYTGPPQIWQGIHARELRLPFEWLGEQEGLCFFPHQVSLSDLLGEVPFRRYVFEIPVKHVRRISPTTGRPIRRPSRPTVKTVHKICAWITSTDYNWEYKGRTFPARPFTPFLEKMRRVLFQHTQTIYDGVFIEYMDNERQHTSFADTFGPVSACGEMWTAQRVFVGFGSTRRLALRNKITHRIIQKQFEMYMQNGQALWMKDERWWHILEHAMLREDRGQDGESAKCAPHLHLCFFQSRDMKQQQAGMSPSEVEGYFEVGGHNAGGWAPDRSPQDPIIYTRDEDVLRRRRLRLEWRRILEEKKQAQHSNDRDGRNRNREQKNRSELDMDTDVKYDYDDDEIYNEYGEYDDDDNDDSDNDNIEHGEEKQWEQNESAGVFLGAESLYEIDEDEMDDEDDYNINEDPNVSGFRVDEVDEDYGMDTEFTEHEEAAVGLKHYEIERLESDEREFKVAVLSFREQMEKKMQAHQNEDDVDEMDPYLHIRRKTKGGLENQEMGPRNVETFNVMEKQKQKQQDKLRIEDDADDLEDLDEIDERELLKSSRGMVEIEPKAELFLNFQQEDFLATPINPLSSYFLNDGETRDQPNPKPVGMIREPLGVKRPASRDGRQNSLFQEITVFNQGEGGLRNKGASEKEEQDENEDEIEEFEMDYFDDEGKEDEEKEYTEGMMKKRSTKRR